MKSNAARAVLGIAALAVAVALFVVLQDDSGEDGADDGATTTTKQAGPGPAGETTDDGPDGPAVPTIVVRDGKYVGPGSIQIVRTVGDRVRFKVRSDEADEAHLHGYDIAEEVPAGGTATFDFVADIEGIFDLEMHHSGETIARLQINP